MLPFINCGNYNISSYILMGIIAHIVSTCFLSFYRKKYKVSLYDALFLCTITFFSGIIGAKLFHLVGEIIKKQNIFSANYWNNHSILSGFVWYGGVVGAFLFILLYCKLRKLEIHNILDFMSFFALIFDAVGRIGCLLSGCCYGVEVEWGIKINGICRFPVPIFESALCLVILLNIIIWEKELKKKGAVFSLYLILYSIGRFILEFFRGDAERGFLGCFSTSQWISLVIVCIFIFYITHKQSIKYGFRKNPHKN